MTNNEHGDAQPDPTSPGQRPPTAEPTEPVSAPPPYGAPAEQSYSDSTQPPYGAPAQPPYDDSPQPYAPAAPYGAPVEQPYGASPPPPPYGAAPPPYGATPPPPPGSYAPASYGGFGAPPHEQYRVSTTNTSAVVLLIVSILAPMLMFVLQPIAAIPAIVALAKQGNDPESSRRWSRGGWITFWVLIAVQILLVIAAIALFAMWASTSSDPGGGWPAEDWPSPSTTSSI